MRSLTLALSLLAVALLPAVASAATPVPVGLSDQNAGAFTDPLFAPLGMRYARYVTPWDVSVRQQPATDKLDAWIAAAEAAGVKPLISFEHSAGDLCPEAPCKAPTVAQYKKAFQAFHARYPEIDEISPWNEASHVTQPTFRKPELAAAYYRAVVDDCQFCTVVAADLLDTSPHMADWLAAFAEAAPEADLWGLHNYGDANYFRTSGLDTVLKTVKGDVWLTETGSIVSFTTAKGKVSFKPSQARAAKAMSYLFDDVVPSSPRVKRVYIYNWLSDPKNRWDSGLVGTDGKPRKIYDIVKAYIGAPAATGARVGPPR